MGKDSLEGVGAGELADGPDDKVVEQRDEVVGGHLGVGEGQAIDSLEQRV